MKKVFLTAFIAAAFAFGMAACNNNAATEEATDTITCTETHECCEHQHECACADTTCALNHCANCTDTNCCKKECMKDGACCQKEGACCKKDGAKEGECQQHKECCKHAE